MAYRPDNILRSTPNWFYKPVIIEVNQQYANSLIQKYQDLLFNDYQKAFLLTKILNYKNNSMNELKLELNDLLKTNWNVIKNIFIVNRNNNRQHITLFVDSFADYITNTPANNDFIQAILDADTQGSPYVNEFTFSVLKKEFINTLDYNIKLCNQLNNSVCEIGKLGTSGFVMKSSSKHNCLEQKMFLVNHLMDLDRNIGKLLQLSRKAFSKQQEKRSIIEMRISELTSPDLRYNDDDDDDDEAFSNRDFISIDMSDISFQLTSTKVETMTETKNIVDKTIFVTNKVIKKSSSVKIAQKIMKKSINCLRKKSQVKKLDILFNSLDKKIEDDINKYDEMLNEISKIVEENKIYGIFYNKNILPLLNIEYEEPEITRKQEITTEIVLEPTILIKNYIKPEYKILETIRNGITECMKLLKKRENRKDDLNKIQNILEKNLKEQMESSKKTKILLDTVITRKYIPYDYKTHITVEKTNTIPVVVKPRKGGPIINPVRIITGRGKHNKIKIIPLKKQLKARYTPKLFQQPSPKRAWNKYVTPKTRIIRSNTIASIKPVRTPYLNLTLESTPKPTPIDYGLKKVHRPLLQTTPVTSFRKFCNRTTVSSTITVRQRKQRSISCVSLFSVAVKTVSQRNVLNSEPRPPWR